MKEKKSLGLKIIAFADTHGYFAKRERFSEFIYQHPQYDLCLLLGDHSPEDVDMILQYVPDYKILGVLGNHDSVDLYKNFRLEHIDLHGKCVEVKGIKIAGIEGSHRYKRGEWPMLTQEESLELVNEMLENYEKADILISHDKPFEKEEYDIAHTGLKGITRYIKEASPAYHLHGHYHTSFTREIENNTISKCIHLAEYLEI